MKCKNCPLLHYSEPDWETNEVDPFCLITELYTDPDEGFCTRQNNWIQKQDKKKILEEQQ